ncbi:MAG: alpha-glucan family phosphorylase [Spirochaetaceae bacterium]|nr:alpha-glucan family phosphorylase [Spirochaetaceae bacterium]
MSQRLTFTVKPNLPPRLSPLATLAEDFWISWHFDAIRLFMRFGNELWTGTNQTPVRLLTEAPQEQLDELERDESFLAHMDRVYASYRAYRDAAPWYRGARDAVVAYFSMEFGLDVTLPIYSGGLGVLSGDHLKSCSDLGLPVVGVGLLYRTGYFRQHVTMEGQQKESYPPNDFHNLPLTPCTSTDGTPVQVAVELGHERAFAQVWRVQVGRVSLYLLDSDIEINDPSARRITAQLYVADRRERLRQELLLGVGGVRALDALGVPVAVTHMNEGHSAFLGLERIRALMRAHGLSFAEARQAVWSTNVFTTHTPVPAGNESFDNHLVLDQAAPLRGELGLNEEEFLALGRAGHDEFGLTPLALRLSAYCNGVSRLHGSVSRSMWSGLWPDVPVEEVPIRHITNGVHPRSWISHDIQDLLERYLGSPDEKYGPEVSVWEQVDNVADEELWHTHERRRERMIWFARQRVVAQLRREHASERDLQAAEVALRPDALTIGFARRFAGYKRAGLLFRRPERLVRLLTDQERPVQVILAGKAHPNDHQGKEMIRHIVQFVADHDLRSRLVFLDDYDISVARYLVSGCDLWLNTPRRPHEASGTSGMKAAVNGSLVLSTLDGWWDEAFSPDIGWAVGAGESYADEEVQDEIEADAVFSELEQNVIPMFYDRGIDGLPRAWIGKMRRSMKQVGQRFSAQRMVAEYHRMFYAPALAQARRMADGGWRDAIDLARYLGRLEQHWPAIAVERLASNSPQTLRVGDRLEVTADVRLGGLSAAEVQVSLYHGTLRARNAGADAITGGECAAMELVAQDGETATYRAQAVCHTTGRVGATVRITPTHPALAHPLVPGLFRQG